MRREKRAFWAAALTVLLLTAEGCAPEPDVPPQPEEPPAVQAEAPNPMPVRRAKPAPVPIPKPRPEPAPEPEEPADETLVTVTDYIPGIFVELKYATEDNFTGQVIYGFTDARLRYGTVKKLARVQAALLEQGYSLKIWDACRPVSAQFALWEVCPDPVYVANPNKGYSSHSRGNTVDVTLVLSDGLRRLLHPGGPGLQRCAGAGPEQLPPAGGRHVRPGLQMLLRGVVAFYGRGLLPSGGVSSRAGERHNGLRQVIKI